jgi:hypothetical protein
VTTHGRILITILPATDSDLSSALAVIWDTYAHSTESWARIMVEQAMSVADTPLAIPYLDKLVKYGLSDFPVVALGKFRGNRKAEEVLLATLGGDRPENAATSLSVLQAWDYVLPVETFSRVLARSNLQISYAALEYAQKINDLAYLPHVSAIAAHADRGLAELAAQVCNELTAHGTWRQ